MDFKLRTASFAAVGKMISVLLVCLGVFAGRVEGQSYYIDISFEPAGTGKVYKTGSDPAIPSAVQTVTPGGSIEFTIAPNQGWEVSKVEVGDYATPSAQYPQGNVSNLQTVSVPAAGGTYTFTNVQKHRAIKVTFAQGQTQVTKHKITISMNEGGGNKYWNANFGSSANIGEPLEVTSSQTTQVYFQAENGYTLTGVKVNGSLDAAALTAKGKTFTNVTSDQTIEAVFTQTAATTKYKIKQTYGTGGKILYDGTSVVSGFEWEVQAGDNSKEFAFQANAGFVLTDVKIDGVSNADALAAKKYTFTNVQGAHEIEAIFGVPSNFNITLHPTSVLNGGKVKINDDYVDAGDTKEVSNGSALTVTFEADAGYELKEVKIGGYANSDALAAGEYTVASVSANVDIYVRFGLPGENPIKPEKSNKLHGIRFVQNVVSQKAIMSVILPNGEKAAETKFVVYDNVGNVISVSIVSGDKKGEWDLTNSSGRIVANGAYLVIAEVKEKNGKVYAYSAKLVVKR